MEAADVGGDGDLCTGESEVLGELNSWVEMAVVVSRNKKDMSADHGDSVYSWKSTLMHT